ncbi:MAG: IS3 family transposase [Bacteroidota bacterium]
MIKKTLISTQSVLSVREQCRLLFLNCASYYYKSTKSEEPLLGNAIVEIYAQYPIYGYRRIRAMLLKRDYQVNVKRVLRIMRELKLKEVYPLAKSSAGSSTHRRYPYLLKDLSVQSSNQVWQVDITYLPTSEGYVYLVALIDVYSRFIVGATLSNTLCTHSCLHVLESALHFYGRPKIINSDQGSQFTSASWCQYLEQQGVQISMTGRGRCRDNAYIERLWRTLKNEGLRLYGWQDMATIRQSLPNWVVWYNTARPHQSLNYRTPKEVYTSDRGEKLGREMLKKGKNISIFCEIGLEEWVHFSTAVPVTT